jgi:hypothetical protein
VCVTIASRPALVAIARLGLGIAAGWLIAILAALGLAFVAVVGLALVKADDGNIGKREGVAENISLLSAVARPAGTVLRATTSEPIASTSGFGTKISGYITWFSYTAPKGTSREEVSTHYRAAFDRAGWDSWDPTSVASATSSARHERVWSAESFVPRLLASRSASRLDRLSLNATRPLEGGRVEK